MMIVADNLHVVNPRIARALADFDPGPIQEMVRLCQKAGAQAIDINSGPLPKRPQQHFTFLVEAVQAVCDLPLVLDTTNPAAMEAGLQACRNPAIINGYSLEAFKLETILPLAVAYDADIIGYLLGPDSQVPVTAEEMMAMALEIYDAASAAGLAVERLILDPVIVPLSWGNGLVHNQAVLTVVRQLPDLLGVPVRTIAGISNLATGPIGAVRKMELETAFVPMLAAAGLHMALLNVFRQTTVQIAKTCNALLGQTVFA